MRAVLTGTGRDVQPERLFGRLPLRSQEPLGHAPQIRSEIEIRPLYEMADFGEALTPEVAELHGRVRDKAGR